MREAAKKRPTLAKTPKNILHILCAEPDDTVSRFIEAISGDSGASVVCLYDDRISRTPVNWKRLVDDIFAHDKVICWN